MLLFLPIAVEHPTCWPSRIIVAARHAAHILPSVRDKGLRNASPILLSGQRVRRSYKRWRIRFCFFVAAAQRISSHLPVIRVFGTPRLFFHLGNAFFVAATHASQNLPGTELDGQRIFS